ncbi:MAG: hypothetical protein ACI8RZ_007676 [Myxococcota bacterium]|jgi:hypothetical protein
MTPETLLALNLPDDLPQVITAIEAELAEGRAPTAIFRGLEILNPLALVDVVIGPRAPGGAAMVPAVGAVIATLESVVPVGPLYRRLVRQAGTGRVAVLQLAASRHEEATWLIPLSRLAEGNQAGHTHLTQAGAHCTPAVLTALCQAHIEAGHRAGLVTASRELARMEPVLALLQVGDLHYAAAGIVALLEVAPDSGFIECIAARWGPGLAPLLAATLSHIPRRAVAEQLSRYTRWYPDIHHVLTERMARLPP